MVSSDRELNGLSNGVFTYFDVALNRVEKAKIPSPAFAFQAYI